MHFCSINRQKPEFIDQYVDSHFFENRNNPVALNALVQHTIGPPA